MAEEQRLREYLVAQCLPRRGRTGRVLKPRDTLVGAIKRWMAIPRDMTREEILDAARAWGQQYGLDLPEGE